MPKNAMSAKTIVGAITALLAVGGMTQLPGQFEGSGVAKANEALAATADLEVRVRGTEHELARIQDDVAKIDSIQTDVTTLNVKFDAMVKRYVTDHAETMSLLRELRTMGMRDRGP